MPAVVTEDWTQRRFVPGKSGQRVFEISGVADEGEAHTALTAFGIEEGIGYPVLVGDAIGVPENGIEYTPKGWNWLATARYEPGVAAGDLTYESTKWRCRLNWVESEDPLIIDAQGRFIVNAAHDPLQTSLTRRQRWPVLEMTRPESGTDVIQKNLTYGGKLNLEAQIFPKIGTAAPGQALIDVIDIAEEFRSSTAKVDVMYRVIFKPYIMANPKDHSAETEMHGFYVPVPNVGLQAWDAASGGKKRRIVYGPSYPKDAHKEPPEPVLLTSYGVPSNLDYRLLKQASPGAAPTFVNPVELEGDAPAPYKVAAGGTAMLYDPTRGSISFSGLNINANL